MSAAVRTAAERLRQRYARHWRVPVEVVEIRYLLDDQDREVAHVWAEGYPSWTTGPVG